MNAKCSVVGAHNSSTLSKSVEKGLASGTASSHQNLFPHKKLCIWLEKTCRDILGYPLMNSNFFSNVTQLHEWEYLLDKKT